MKFTKHLSISSAQNYILINQTIPPVPFSMENKTIPQPLHMENKPFPQPLPIGKQTLPPAPSRKDKGRDANY
jgi:hypothetical protein